MPVTERSPLLAQRTVNHVENPDESLRKLLVKTTMLIFVILAPCAVFYFIYYVGMVNAGRNVSYKPQLKNTSGSIYPTVANPQSPGDLWGNVRKPYPTGAFWTNLVVGSGDNPIYSYPYGVKCLNQRIEVSYSAFRRQVTPNLVSDLFMVDVALSFVERVVKHHVQSYGDTSVAMEYVTRVNSKEKSSYMYIVKGAPFMTMEYNGNTPLITSSVMKILSFESYTCKSDCSYLDENFGAAYILTLGNFQKWMVYISESSVKLLCTNDSIVGSKPMSIDGYVRIGVLPLQKWEVASSALLPFIQRYPVGTRRLVQHGKDNVTKPARFATSLGDSSSTRSKGMTLTFHYKTKGAGQLIMYSLPHHRDILTTIDLTLTPSEHIGEHGDLDLIHKLSPIYSIKGKLLPVIGDLWELVYPAVEGASWLFSPYLAVASPKDRANSVLESRSESEGEASSFMHRGICPYEMTPQEFDVIATALASDLDISPIRVVDPYSSGKSLARLGRLVLVAEELLQLQRRDNHLMFRDNKRTILTLQQKAIAQLEDALTPWIRFQNEDTLLYDTTYGGIVPKLGIEDKNADFGAGYYNDHHFHYGYFVYAAAVLAKVNSTVWWEGEAIFDLLTKDICNWDTASQDFPVARHKDFFDGHSWASGLSPQGNGKGQESSTEATNAYYACYLYGDATHKHQLKDFSHLLLSMEVHSVHTYWHISDTTVYDSLFAANRMAGNVGASDITASTWFGSDVEYVHGINILPLVPLTAELFDPKFVQLEWPNIQRRLDDVALNRTGDESVASSECTKHSVCKALGLVEGSCCPTTPTHLKANGVMLDCCGASEGSPISDEWMALLHAVHAVIDARPAWREAQTLGDLGIGGSKSNLLLWILSCVHHHAVPLNVEVESDIQVDDNGTVVIPDQCRDNSACDSLGMEGLCCPNTDQLYLQCCPAV